MKKGLFTKENYVLMLAGVAIIAIGFMLMAGGANEDITIFNPEEVYSTRRTTIAPVVVLLGFIVEIFAIFYKSKKDA